MNPTELMSYIGSPEPQYGARKYTGTVATGYDAKRVESPKWAAEQAIIEGMLADLPAGSKVVDCPVGTGRFIPYYESRGFNALGADISVDMLEQAAAKISGTFGKVSLVQANAMALPIQDGEVDAALFIRLTRWLSVEDCQKVMREMTRVSRDRVILTCRIAEHPHMRPLSIFEEAAPDWRVVRNEEADGPNYRVVMFQRKGE